jgi:diadenosine tetraphosphatase ApaH/serine/threonine PP2A family protein phosphatase
MTAVDSLALQVDGEEEGLQGQHLRTYDELVKENECLRAQLLLANARRGSADVACIKHHLGQDSSKISSISNGLSDFDKGARPSSMPPQKRVMSMKSKHSHHVMDQGKISRRHMRHVAGSEASAALLNSLMTPRETVSTRIMARIETESDSTYFFSTEFGRDLTNICAAAQTLFANEARCLDIQSPAHVFGDIHGNLGDLHFFHDTIWHKGVNLTPGKFVFLGDYVDRGMKSLECVAYLFAMKVQNPTKVFLLRGNHELRDVNSWEDYYGEGCFLAQCRTRFGKYRGEVLWEAVNAAFDTLPLACVIDRDVFCIHGGIPRPRNGVSQIDSILRVPNRAVVSPAQPTEDADTARVAYECLWSDPALYQDEKLLDKDGYGANPRGATAQTFGSTAVDDFLSQNDLSFIIRAHQKTADGFALCKNARVLTVFSTSEDHNLGVHALSACLLIDDDRIEVITKDPKWRRAIKKPTSISMASPSSHFFRAGPQEASESMDEDDEAVDGSRIQLDRRDSLDAGDFLQMRKAGYSEPEDLSDASDSEHISNALSHPGVTGIGWLLRMGGSPWKSP